MQDSPVVLWWTPFTGQTGDWRTCGEDTCYFTENRTFLNDARTQVHLYYFYSWMVWRIGLLYDYYHRQVVMFYGSSFSSLDLPLPRSSAKQNWALLHEESPKNNPSFCYSDLIGLFNYTATWSRRSNFPLTLLSLPSLNDMTGTWNMKFPSHCSITCLILFVSNIYWRADLKYFVPTAEKNRLIQREGLSPVVYVQSSCDAPSDRDSYVTELMKFIRIDAYGKCLNNKQLPAQWVLSFLLELCAVKKKNLSFHISTRQKFDQSSWYDEWRRISPADGKVQVHTCFWKCHWGGLHNRKALATPKTWFRSHLFGISQR